jgi:hypothetical protein
MFWSDDCQATRRINFGDTFCTSFTNESPFFLEHRSNSSSANPAAATHAALTVCVLVCAQVFPSFRWGTP